MIFNRTSGNSSRSIVKNIGRRCEIVLAYVSTTQARGPAHGNVLVFPENRGQPADLGAKSSSNMLGLIRDELLYARHDLLEKSLALEQSAEAYMTVSAGQACVRQRSSPGICPAIALRTSASVSLRSLTKAGTKSRLTTSSSTAFAI